VLFGADVSTSSWPGMTRSWNDGEKHGSNPLHNLVARLVSGTTGAGFLKAESKRIVRQTRAFLAAALVL
jgi:hypothetical protein